MSQYSSTFTYAYSQPDDYHFSLDSIHLAEFMALRLQHRTELSTLRVLDLCAGSGVIGIELSWYRPELRTIDFVEVQDIYTRHFYHNCSVVNRPELTLQWHRINYELLCEKQWEQTYDLIISNPPYFQAHQGMLSPSDFKNRCRFFLDSTFHYFIKAICNALTEKGEAYFLMRDLKDHGCDLLQEANDILKGSSAQAQVIFNLRGMHVVKLSKKNQAASLVLSD